MHGMQKLATDLARARELVVLAHEGGLIALITLQIVFAVPAQQ